MILQQAPAGAHCMLAQQAWTWGSSGRCRLCQCKVESSLGLQDLLETVSTALASATSGQEAAQRLVKAAEARAQAAAQVSCRVQTLPWRLPWM